MIVRAIGAFVIGWFLGLVILLGVACVIGIAAAVVQIFRIIMDFMR